MTLNHADIIALCCYHDDSCCLGFLLQQTKLDRTSQIVFEQDVCAQSLFLFVIEGAQRHTCSSIALNPLMHADNTRMTA